MIVAMLAKVASALLDHAAKPKPAAAVEEVLARELRIATDRAALKAMIDSAPERAYVVVVVRSHHHITTGFAAHPKAGPLGDDDLHTTLTLAAQRFLIATARQLCGDSACTECGPRRDGEPGYRRDTEDA